MPEIEDTARELSDELKKHTADYIEARLEESQTSHITYRGRELDSIGRSTATGGNVRALVKGGWGFVSFNNFNELSGRVALAVEQARLTGSSQSRLANVKPVIDEVLAEADKNPFALPERNFPPGSG